jgi:hypothetical protein
MSSLSAPGVLIPAKTPPAEKPLAEETVPFGTDAMGSVMAIFTGFRLSYLETGALTI